MDQPQMGWTRGKWYLRTFLKTPILEQRDTLFKYLKWNKEKQIAPIRSSEASER